MLPFTKVLIGGSVKIYSSFVRIRAWTQFVRLVSVMAQPATGNNAYEAAVSQLNALQSNAITIQKLRRKRDLFQGINLAETAMFMEQCDIKSEDLDKLNVIHVSGTKGKGSTCAFTESILRQLGYKTGFYSSPHLVHVRERIRINGRPLSETAFTKYFYSVYDRLQSKVGVDGMMPAYFKFLTLMAFHVFIEEKVDVAVIEVGIGGEHDCTNVIKNPVVCGVTTLDMDHTSILGSTLEEIAWQKAGIFKPGSIAIVADQTESTMKVMRSRAHEKKCELRVAPAFASYGWPCEQLEIGIQGQHQHWNISLAMQLTKAWLQRLKLSDEIFAKDENDVSSPASVLPSFQVPDPFLDGIRRCEWPGRSQVVRQPGLTYYLDGAHTPKSLQCCVEWYKWERERLPTKTQSKPFRVLLFHCTADRTPDSLLPPLVDCGIDLAVFCPTRLRSVLDLRSDHANLNQSEKEQLLRARENFNVWNTLTQKSGQAQVVDCIESAVSSIEHLHEQGREVEVLVTGSLHLVGGVLSFIQPHT